MSTLLQLINTVLRRTGQIEVTSLSAASTPAVQTVDFLNETYTEMLQRLRVNRLQRTASMTTVADTSSYSLASGADISGLIGDSVLETGQEVRLIEVDYTWPVKHGVDTTGLPTAFYRQGEQINLYPTPDAAYTITYAYWATPAVLSADTDTTELPEDWEHVLILGTQARLEKFLGESADDSYFLYRDALGQIKSRAQHKPYPRMRGTFRGGQQP